MTPTTQLVVSGLCILAGGPGCLWLLFRDLRSDKTTFPHDFGFESHYDRYQQPFSFWGCIVIYAVGGVMALSTGSWLFIDAIGRLQE